MLIIVQNLPVPLDRRVWLECRALRQAGFNVSVICPKGQGHDEPFQEIEGVRIHRYDPPAQANGVLGFAWEAAYCWLVTALLTLRIMLRRRVHVLQACNPPDTYFALAALLKPFGTRFVFDQHDLCPELYDVRFPRGPKWAKKALLGLEGATYRLADHVITTNESFRNIALTRGRVTQDAVTVVRSGPIAASMRRAAADPKLKQGRAHLACYLGVMGPQDGVDLLLHAIASFVYERGRTDTHFALMGFGDCYDDLRRLATELRLDPWVTFTGKADLDMITAYLSTADLGLAPDPQNGFNDLCTMNKVVEYMAYELPIVSFSLRETRVSAADSAVYVEGNSTTEFATAIDRILDQPERRMTMGRLGRARIETTLSWECQQSTYVGAYLDLVRFPTPTQRKTSPPSVVG